MVPACNHGPNTNVALQSIQKLDDRINNIFMVSEAETLQAAAGMLLGLQQYERKRSSACKSIAGTRPRTL